MWGLSEKVWQKPLTQSRSDIYKKKHRSTPLWIPAKGALVATTTDAPADASRTSARVHVQKFGTFLSNMVMPNIGAFIA